ncbi:hypothetical protein FSP39_021284 [Pinctada imbricata]|uniref:SGNH hydrolase-type esterase domain-containing protein n=1 Tax=Pinctada imbricata TaxID=66713 RepID=A0AA89BZ64_PINIB|nr:hypothetical protein FSP39_021284 [Pinctada imbricata]
MLVANFIAYLSCNGYAAATARSYISALNFKCKSESLSDFSQSFIITKLLEGFCRSNNRPDSRLPITLDILGRIIAVLPLVCTSNYEATLFSAACSLAFHAFLRVGEFTLAKGNSPTSVLSFSDISLSPDNLVLCIRSSKTDQHGKGASIILSRTDTPSCPLKWLREFLDVRPVFPGPLFCHFDGTPLTRYQFSTITSRAISGLGLNASRYKTHSFRIGAATTAACNGVSSDVIQAADTPTIWLFGSSLVKRAFFSLKTQSEDLNLGLRATLWWQGYSGMTMKRARKRLRHLAAVGETPQVILVHCGANDLGVHPLRQTLRDTVAVYNFLSTRFPNATLIWSNAIPREALSFANNKKALEKARCRLNRHATKTFTQTGTTLSHPQFSSKKPNLFISDGVHLSFEGNQLFCQNIKRALATALNQ